MPQLVVSLTKRYKGCNKGANNIDNNCRYVRTLHHQNKSPVSSMLKGTPLKYGPIKTFYMKEDAKLEEPFMKMERFGIPVYFRMEKLIVSHVNAR